LERVRRKPSQFVDIDPFLLAWDVIVSDAWKGATPRRVTGEMLLPTVDDEVLWGARKIGERVGLSERQASDKLQRGLLPAKKIGDSWVSTAQALRTAVTPEFKA
jgi:hypothetical protein